MVGKNNSIEKILNFRNKISNGESVQILYKKFEIYTSLSVEINLLIESFNKDKNIDLIQLDNICRLFIESQNSLSKIYPNIELSNYKIEKFPTNNVVKIYFLLNEFNKGNE